MQSNDLSPKLAPPGAGLPWIELQVARAIFAINLAVSTKLKDSERIIREQREILKLNEPRSTEELSKQVLIKRLPGLEDSSRFWLVFMTLSHIAIVNRAVYQTIELLRRNEVPRTAASTANVKPNADAGPETVKEFLKSCEELLVQESSESALKTSRNYSHPWFGPLDARGWYFLAGFHLLLHRRQIEAICRKIEGGMAAAQKDL